MAKSVQSTTAPHWDDLKTVLVLERHRTLADAGAALGLNYTTVARRIARIEGVLGEVLFEKLADGYRATETGQMVAQYAGKMEAAEQGLMRQLPKIGDSLVGALVITAPQLLIATHLTTVIERFCEAYPEVDLHIRATNDLLDLDRREADLAIRISSSPGGNLTGLRLCAQSSASFANEELAAKMRAQPDAPVDWIVYSATKDGPLSTLYSGENARIKMRFDDMVAMVGAAQAGLGVVRMPMFLGRASAGLVQVPAMAVQPYADIWVVAHPDVWRSAKVTAFRKVLVAYFRENRGVFVG